MPKKESRQIKVPPSQQPAARSDSAASVSRAMEERGDSKRVVGLRVSTETTTITHSPLPPVREIKALEKECGVQNAGERFVRLAENQSAHRRSMEQRRQRVSESVSNHYKFLRHAGLLFVVVVSFTLTENIVIAIVPVGLICIFFSHPRMIERIVDAFRSSRDRK